MNGPAKPGSVPLQACCALVLWLVVANVAPALPVSFVKTPPEINQTGDVILHWDSQTPGALHQVEHSRDAEFSDPDLWYEGASRQAFISGMDDGEHFYRVRARADETQQWGGWSEPLRLSVERQSLALAWKLFATGSVLFVSIAAFITYHSTRETRGSDAR